MIVNYQGRSHLEHRNFHGCVLDTPPPGVKVHMELCMGLPDESVESLLSYMQFFHKKGLELKPEDLMLMRACEAGLSVDPSLPEPDQARVTQDLALYNVLVTFSAENECSLNNLCFGTNELVGTRG